MGAPRRPSGDCLAAVDWSGCGDQFVNDAGNQIGKFGKSVRYLQSYCGGLSPVSGRRSGAARPVRTFVSGDKCVPAYRRRETLFGSSFCSDAPSLPTPCRRLNATTGSPHPMRFVNASRSALWPWWTSCPRPNGCHRNHAAPKYGAVSRKEDRRRRTEEPGRRSSCPLTYFAADIFTTRLAGRHTRQTIDVWGALRLPRRPAMDAIVPRLIIRCRWSAVSPSGCPSAIARPPAGRPHRWRAS